MSNFKMYNKPPGLNQGLMVCDDFTKIESEEMNLIRAYNSRGWGDQGSLLHLKLTFKFESQECFLLNKTI